MKAIVLCAGLGTRLRPLTYSVAKHLIPVANKPVLLYGLESIVGAGVREIGIIINNDTRDAIEKAVGTGAQLGAKVSYIEQPTPLGLAHAAKCARGFIGQEPFLMYLGDNLILEGLRKMTDVFRSEKPNAVVMLAEVDEPSRYGIAQLEGGHIVRVVEKPKEPSSKLAIVGGYLFDHNVFDSIDRLKPSERGEYEITDAIQDLIDHGFTVRPYVVKGWWKDTGKPEDILEANRIILEGIEGNVQGTVEGESSVTGRVIIGTGSEIRSSRIRGPVVIGKDVRIENAFIGPFTSIGDRVHVRESEVEHSVIMEDCVITDIDGRIDGSLLGKNVHLTRTAGRPKVYRFYLGDDSKSELM
jgi:glucose-1-phosphate thymidylyltransferase